MKYTIEGFSQEYALSLVDNVPYKKTTKEIRLDFADLVILRWFVDYYPKMKKQTINKEDYALVVYSKVIADLPLLNINKRGIADRFQKLCHFKILKYELVKKKGTFTFFAFGENYIKLIDNAMQDGCGLTSNGGCVLTDNGVVVQPTNKDISITDNSIIKENKKESSANNEFSSTDNESLPSTPPLSAKKEESLTDIESDKCITWFEYIYNIYPRKESKVTGKSTFMKKIAGMSETEAYKVAKGIYRMLKSQNEIWQEENNGKGRAREFYPLFSSWLNANCEDSPHFKRKRKC